MRLKVTEHGEARWFRVVLWEVELAENDSRLGALHTLHNLREHFTWDAQIVGDVPKNEGGRRHITLGEPSSHVFFGGIWIRSAVEQRRQFDELENMIDGNT